MATAARLHPKSGAWIDPATGSARIDSHADQDNWAPSTIRARATRHDEPFRLPGWRAPRRGRAAGAHRRDRSARRSTAIRRRPWSVTIRVLRGRLAGLDAHHLLSRSRPTANLAVIRTLAALGAGADVVSEGEVRRALAAGVPAERIVFSGRGQDRSRTGVRHRPRASCRSTSSPSRNWSMLDAVGRAPGARRPSPAGQPRRRRQQPRQDRHRQGGEQVRRRMAARPSGATPAQQHAGRRGRRRGRPYRLADDQLDPFRAAFAEPARPGGDAARRRASPSTAWIWAAGSACPMATKAPSRRLAPPTTRAVVREVLGGLGCALVFEPGRLMVGQCRRAGQPGDPRQARREAQPSWSATRR